MRIGLLGPVEVWHEGGTIDIGSPLQRCVLALLALEPGRVVPVERIAEALWDGRPPAGMRRVIQTYVSRLRAALRPAGLVITLRKPGYLLEPGAKIDLYEFRDLTARARQTGNRELAIRALGLWRGEPLAGLHPTNLVDRLRAGLEEEHLLAREDFLEAELEAGLHQEILAELAALAAEYPLRDRPLRLQLVGLLHSGRQAEALGVYEEARKYRAEELGLDLGTELEALHARILRNEQFTPAAPVPAAPPAGPPVAPKLLPYGVQDFTGRTAELAELARLSAESNTAVVISALDGMPGVGKTATAIRAAHALAGHFPDGQLFCDLHGFTPGREPVTPLSALQTLLRALGVPREHVPSDVDECSALWRHELAGRRALVVLDNAADPAQVRPLIPGVPGSMVLVTSRRRMTGLDGAVPVLLDVLPPGDALDLFAQIAGARALADAEGTAEVLRLCGYLPLAIRIAASRLRARPSWTVADLAARLTGQQRRLVELTADDRSVHACIMVSYEHLTSREQWVFRVLGLLPGDVVEPYAVAALAGLPLAETERILDDLADAHLIAEVAAGRYQFHDLLREYARDVVCAEETAGIREDALDRLYGYYLHALHRADQVLRGQPDPRQGAPDVPEPACLPELGSQEAALAWLDADHAGVTAAIMAARAHGRPQHAVTLARGLQHYLQRRSLIQEWQAGHTCALAAAEGLGDEAGHSDILNSLGTLQMELGNYAEAERVYLVALESRKRLGDPLRIAAAISNLAYTMEAQDRLDEARRLYQESLAVYRDNGLLRHAFHTLNNMGVLHGRLNRYTEALGYLQEGLAVAREEGHLQIQTSLLNNLGLVYEHFGQLDESARHFREALALNRSIGDLRGEAKSLGYLANVYRGQGAYPQAVECHHEALDLTRKTGYRLRECKTLIDLGVTLRAMGNEEQARRYFRQAGALAGEHGYEQGQREAARHLAAEAPSRTPAASRP
ncbi:AfsR/SARP family transcriptional regulator [Longispora albida]|uniref:AfsR/SARP family transcriptional regulator n=1 Tax=Longispora albida TaxID=203523 RepID=UPI00036A142B|nr:tetratricopeptide repeat protein [Longispora albida]